MPDDTSSIATFLSDSTSETALVVGPELRRLLDLKFGDNAPAKSSVQQSTMRILEKCIDPNSADSASSTGLVVGYVQSGKTLSFTAVAAAAHDNGFRTVVVIAGSSLNLADQNQDRLARDFQLGDRFLPPWHRKHNPTIADLHELQTALASWSDGDGKTLLLTALKHQTHVESVGDVIAALGDLAAPMLIIDDEADQVSLNTRVRQGNESANYSQILGLRDRAPRHTYLQYTATPQANIFIPLWDRLAPSFCELLEPGADYVGGYDVFVDRACDIVHRISDDDIQRAANQDPELPPESLYRALQIFLLGVVQGLVEYEDSGTDPEPKYRSMMVHPDRTQASHQYFVNLIRGAKESWARLLADPADPDRGPLVDQFRAAYEELRLTDHSSVLAPFERLMASLPKWMAQTQIREVNRRQGVERVDWRTEWDKAYSWILVGGQGLDRGFTVEGLTVTYMPRGIGVGQADTLQQRARFLGYKSGYIDLCRIYLDQVAIDAYTSYVRSERSMRDFLDRHRDQLDDPTIPRQFELDPALRPTRRQVLLNDPGRFTRQHGWLSQRHAINHIDRCRRNGELINTFVASRGGATTRNEGSWINCEPSEVQDGFRHNVCSDIPLRDLYVELLSNIVLPDQDEHLQWQASMVMIENALDEYEDLQAGLALMRPSMRPFRGIDDSRKILAVFAGAQPATEPYSYQGDTHVRLGDATLQLHVFDLGLGTDSASATGRQVEVERVPIVALWLGDRVNRPMIGQAPQAS